MRRKTDLNITQPEMPAEKAQEELVNSYAVAKRLLPFMAKRGIPASPRNYRIFYDYLLYSNPLLNKAVNELLENNAKFHSRLSGTVYEHFYSGEAVDRQTKAIHKAATEFMTISSDMERNLEEAISHSTHYQKVLTNTSRQMAGMAAADQLQPFLEELLNETESALAMHDDFSNKMAEANQIIASLKTELKSQATMAKIDELTKLYNRRHFNVEVPKLMAQADGTSQPLSIITFDLDFFKKINDTWGHNFGDKVLVVCSEIIRKAARATDLAVRMGGEEFVLICVGLGLDGAVKVADRIRRAIAETDITIRGNALPVTVSAGVTQYSVGEDALTMLERADQALYQAKREGRNMVRALTTNKNQPPETQEIADEPLEADSAAASES